MKYTAGNQDSTTQAQPNCKCRHWSIGGKIHTEKTRNMNMIDKN